MFSILRRVLPAIALLALLSPTSATAEDAQKITFSFAPTDGERWIRTGEYVSLRDLGGANPISETRTIHEMSMEYRSVDDGWEVVQTAHRAQLLADGVEHANKAMEQTIGLPITLHLDASGRASSAKGFRALMRRLEDALPAAEYQAVSSRMTQENFEQTELHGWNKRFELFGGETVSIGEKWLIKKYHAFGQNSHPVEGVIRFEGWAELDGQRVFKILFDADNQGIAVGRHGEGATRTVDLTAGPSKDARSNLDIRLTDILMVEPATGQVIYVSEEDQIDLTSTEFKDMPGTEGHFENRNVERWKRVE